MSFIYLVIAVAGVLALVWYVKWLRTAPTTDLIEDDEPELLGISPGKRHPSTSYKSMTPSPGSVTDSSSLTGNSGTDALLFANMLDTPSPTSHADHYSSSSSSPEVGHSVSHDYGSSHSHDYGSTAPDSSSAADSTSYSGD